MNANTITVYNCTGQKVKMIASCSVSTGAFDYPAPQSTLLQAYSDSPIVATFNVSYPYNTFTFIGDTLFGQTNYYQLSNQSNYNSTAETQWNYTIFVGISPDTLIASDNSDVSSEMLEISQSGACIGSSGGLPQSTCGYVYLGKYPSWFINGIEGLTGFTLSANTINTKLVIFVLVILALIFIAIAAVIIIKRRT